MRGVMEEVARLEDEMKEQLNVSESRTTAAEIDVKKGDLKLEEVCGFVQPVVPCASRGDVGAFENATHTHARMRARARTQAAKLQRWAARKKWIVIVTIVVILVAATAGVLTWLLTQ